MDYSVSTEFQKPIFSEEKFPFVLHNDTICTSYKVLPHWHDEVEILYFQEGECYAYCDQKKVHCRPGDILFFNSYCIHGLEEISSACNYLCFFFNQKILTSKVNPYIPLNSFIQLKEPTLQRILENVNNEFYAEKEESMEIIRHAINTFYLYLHRIISENDASALLCLGQKSSVSHSVQDESIQKALTYINEHLNEHISLTEICDFCGFSTSRFSFLFKQYTGKSLVDYINISRCRLAYTFYVNNGYTVSESAHAAGFENLSYFSRKFKEIYGFTLSEIPR